MRFWGVTGTNGKTTTAWIFAEFVNAWDAEIEHPVAVVELKEDRRAEEGGEFLNGDIAAAFGREP